MGTEIGLQQNNILKFIRKEPVTFVSGILALASVFILVGFCFFLAPFITNDVALITFVPFAIFILEMAGLKEYIIPTLALQTIAAHMGSSISPVGNPHNLYLHEMSGLSSGEFIR